jgi:hypothetical protein
LRPLLNCILLMACPLAAIVIAEAYPATNGKRDDDSIPVLIVTFLFFAHLAISIWSAIFVSWVWGESIIRWAVWIGIALLLPVAFIVFGYAQLILSGDCF